MAESSLPPDSIDMNNMHLYRNHRLFKEDGKNGVIAYKGQFYGFSGRKLPHDPVYLRKHNFTMTKEMADILLQKAESEFKDCTSGCGYKKLPTNAKFCVACGAAQIKLVTETEGDMLVKILQNIDPENPFALADVLVERDMSKADPRTFMNESHIKDIIDREFTARGLVNMSAVPGEAAVPLKPQYSAKPFADVTYDAIGV